MMIIHVSVDKLLKCGVPCACPSLLLSLSLSLCFSLFLSHTHDAADEMASVANEQASFADEHHVGRQQVIRYISSPQQSVFTSIVACRCDGCDYAFDRLIGLLVSQRASDCILVAAGRGESATHAGTAIQERQPG